MIVSSQMEEAVRKTVQVFDGLELSYAIGGAVAMAFGGYPRGTRDLDVLILLPALRSQDLADALNAAGFRMRDEDETPIPVDVPRMVRSFRDLGHFRIWWNDTKVEVFTPRVPLQDAVLQRRVRVPLGNESLWITTVEDLILLKMVFHRPKDVEDVRRMLAANRGALDLPYIEGWIPRTLETTIGEELKDLIRRSVQDA